MVRDCRIEDRNASCFPGQLINHYVWYCTLYRTHVQWIHSWGVTWR